MAEAMRRSWANIPQFVQTMHFNAAGLQRARERAREMGQRLTYTDLIVAVAARVIPEHPLVNAEYRPDGVRTFRHVNLAIAIETPAGLVTPIVHRAETLALSATAERIRDLASRARDGGLTPADFDSATISLSNLGMFGVEWGTPLINPPQSAVIFVGAMTERLTLVEGHVVAVPEIALSIAYDHRVVDGATGARFTAALAGALADPDERLRAAQ